MKLTTNPTNFLIIRLSSLGDVVLTTPLIRRIRENFKDARIDFLVKIQFADILKHNPHIDNIFVYDNNKKEIIEKIKQEKIDYFIIDLQNNLISKSISRKISDNRIKFHKNIWKKIALV
jgi:ADP-heptose:LPS heptosyltransferase